MAPGVAGRLGRERLSLTFDLADHFAPEPRQSNVGLVTRIVTWLAVLYVALLVVGRSGLPMNAQWGDLVLPLLTMAVAWEQPLRRWWRAQDWPLALYLLATLVTAVVSAEPSTGLRHLAKQLSVALIFLVFRQLADDSLLTRTLAKTFVLTVAVITLASVLDVFLRPWTGVVPALLGASATLPFLGLVGRLRGGFLTPEMLGNALLVAFALVLALRAGCRGGARAVWTGAATLLAAGEFLTFSHSVAGFAVAAMVFVSGAVPSRPARYLAWSAAIGVVMTVNAASVVEPGPAANDYGVGPVSFQVMGARVQGELIHYAALKQVAWSAFLDHPLTGVGPGQFDRETERAFERGRLNARYRNKPPQSDFLGRLAETGILGGFSLLLLWGSWLRSGLALSKGCVMPRAAFAAVVGLLVNSVNADVMNFRFLWLAVAWMSAPIEGDTEGAQPAAGDAAGL